MKSLCIESSQQNLTLALFDHIAHKTIVHKELKSSDLKNGKKHSSSLVLEIQTLLDEAHLNKEDLSVISAGLGPGSFIGTRVGIITAKTLAYGLEIPVTYFCSLELYSPNIDGMFAILSDAKSKGVYVSFGEMKNGNIRFHKEPTLYTIDKFLAKVSKDTLLLSPEAPVIQQKIPSALHLKVQPASIDFALWEKTICQKSFLNPLVTDKASEPYTLRVS